ncbi:hypothetical protein RA210_U110078 [Rubrivivax sp. A210]|nr:hypothetical protein RA210_U110078 [Rubrivivax sp. A210]
MAGSALPNGLPSLAGGIAGAPGFGNPQTVAAAGRSPAWTANEGEGKPCKSGLNPAIAGAFDRSNHPSAPTLGLIIPPAFRSGWHTVRVLLFPCLKCNAWQS